MGELTHGTYYYEAPDRSWLGLFDTERKRGRLMYASGEAVDLHWPDDKETIQTIIRKGELTPLA